MGKTRRRLFPAVSLTALALLVGACGGGAATTTPAKVETKTEAKAAQPNVGIPTAGNAPAAVSSPASTRSPELIKLIEAAKAEGTVTLTGYLTTPEEIAALEKAFQEYFGFPLKLKVDQTNPRELPPKVNSGEFDVTNHSVVTAHDIQKIRGLEEVDFKMFYTEFPNLERLYQERSADDIPCVLTYTPSYGIAWNTTLVKELEVPDTIDGLLDPKWKNLVNLDTNATPIDLMAIRYGRERILDWGQKMLANDPAFSNTGASGQTAMLLSGEARLSVVGMATALTQKNKGAPIDVRPFKDVVPYLINVGCVPKDPPHPNMARLFLAWLAARGNAVVAESSAKLRALPGDDNSLTRTMDKYGVTFDKWVTFKTPEEEKLRVDTATALTRMWTRTQ